MTDPIVKTGLAGVLAGMERAARDAQAVVDAMSPEGDGDPVPAMIALKQDQHQVEASAKVIKVGKELQDEVLDILA